MVISFNASDQGNIPLYMRTLTYKCLLEAPTHTESFVQQMFIENLLCAGHHLGTEDVEVEELGSLHPKSFHSSRWRHNPYGNK